MHPIDHPGSLIVAVLVFQLIPGPGTLAILRATGQYGMKAGFASVSGTLLGGLLCMAAAPRQHLRVAPHADQRQGDPRRDRQRRARHRESG